MTTYTLKLETITPVHIGDGNELRQSFDFIPAKRNGRDITLRLNEDAILQQKPQALVPDRAGKYKTPGELLDEADKSNPALFRYSLDGKPRSEKLDARIRSCIKDVFDQPYVPGSSLKGAIRTAIAWSALTELKKPLSSFELDNKKDKAATNIEKFIFGKNPNYDLFKVLQISDLLGPTQAGEGLILVNAQVVTRKENGSPVELEAVRNNIQFQGSLKIDETFFTPEAEEILQFSGKRKWLENLLNLVNLHSTERIKTLKQWFTEVDANSQVARAYNSLYTNIQSLQGTQYAMLQLGWGTGWDDKTYWTHLQKDPAFFEVYVIQNYRMLKPKSSPRRSGDPFPRSRKVIMKNDTPAVPLGWVLLELQEK